MPDMKLVSYLRKYKDQGYSLEELRSHLIKLGYKQELVDDSINVLNVMTNFPSKKFKNPV